MHNLRGEVIKIRSMMKTSIQLLVLFILLGRYGTCGFTRTSQNLYSSQHSAINYHTTKMVTHTWSIFLNSHRNHRASTTLHSLSAEDGISRMDSAPQYFHSRKSYEEIGLNAKVMSGVLKSLGLERPSKIQALAFKEIYTGANCILADQTGSGKTFAYLLPLLQRIVELQREKIIPSPPESRAPYIVVITPTTELALQVSKVVRSVANALKFRSACITAISDMDAEQKKLRLGAEILISTPGRIIALLEKNQVSLSRTQAIVLDEADVLFLDESFPLKPIGEAVADVCDH